MRRRWMLLVAWGALSIASVANAERQPSQLAPTEGRSDELKKHLGEIDVYLTDARNHARLLHQRSTLSAGYQDSLLLRETIGNLERDLSGAEKHLSHLRTLPPSVATEPARLEELSRDLSQARVQLTGLAHLSQATPRAPLRELTTGLYEALSRADGDFGAIASMAGLQRVEQLPDASEKHPVRGRLDELDEDHDLGGGRFGSHGLDEGRLSPERPVPYPGASSSDREGWPPRF